VACGLRTGGRAAALLGVVALACALAGSSTTAAASEPPTFAKDLRAIKGLTGAKRQARLLELARQEGGTLTFYSSINAAVATELAKSFEAATGIKVSVYRSTDEDVARRITAEVGAGIAGADVADTNGSQLVFLNSSKLLVPYATPQRSKIAKTSRFPGWTAERFQRFDVGWNTNIVTPARRPRTWAGLAASRWKGGLALESTDYDWYATLRDYWIKRGHMSPARAERLFRQLASNSVVFRGHQVIASLLSAGEYAFAISMLTNVIDQLRDDGAPVAWRPPFEPVIARPAGVGLVRNAAHPAAALLWVDWVLSSAQPLFVREHYESVRNDLRRTAPRKEIVIDVVRISARQAELQAEYAKVLSFARPA
jgi:iron(III) transport system substrate-binding protein